MAYDSKLPWNRQHKENLSESEDFMLLEMSTANLKHILIVLYGTVYYI